MSSRIRRSLCYAWAFFPNTLLGLGVAAVTRGSGGRVRIVAGVVEVSGGFAAWLLRRAVPLQGGARALTLGHVVLGLDERALAATREHERVHVRQYERWGPLFLPAYGLAGIGAWIRTGDAYRANAFERAAYTVSQTRCERSLKAGRAAGVGRDTSGLRSIMSEQTPTFSDPADQAGNSRLWLPVLAVILAFLIGAAILIFSGLFSDVESESPAPAEVEDSPVAQPGDVG